MSLRITFFGSLVALVALVALVGARPGSANPASTDAPAQALDSSSALDSLLAAPSLDLGILERAVLQRNPSLGAIRAAWRAAEAAADQA